ncbi:MAG: trehalose-6-phosphate synthase [Candidatus Nitricoxidivorans perseverans]|uniref:Trehalose-6-phosphate synthase n=1 Tax=Candidatus Nitricoxidivorans perseverans TaxID=2975601 RepID=A0AA49FKY9_9PROT|nr:MAG: trehalose-6-phosphate synthase [Candidatus Nitricoxidivorans perseverans]
MRLSLRFILPLAFVLAAIAYTVVPLVDQLTLRWFVRDIDIRASLVANAIQDSVMESANMGSRVKMAALFNKITQDERLYALGYCAVEQAQPVASRTFPRNVACADLARYEKGPDHLLPSEQGPLHVTVEPIESEGAVLGRLVLVHDMSFIQRRSEETKKYVFYFFILLGSVVSLLTVVIAQLSWRGWVQGMRALLRGEGLLRPSERVTMPELRPFERDLRSLVRDLETDFRARDESQVTWTPDALRAILRDDLSGENILVVSNREPYIHDRKGDVVEVRRPASGLVTALEPIMRACSGTWIAHGGGSADRETVGRHDRVAVPPSMPAYNIRRVWLTAEEEAGYYYGFANEGLWPLCHIAHVRPIFRSSDWKHYTEVNLKFAQAVVEEAKVDNPIVLVQDYHLALLPRLIRERLPNATVITFWHIPWPNPEAFAICPWQAEILDGLLGSSILGFHTQFHCNNFMDSVDRTLESRVDRELFTVTYGGKTTAVKRYPISIEWPPEVVRTLPVAAECRAAVHRRHGLADDHLLGVGVDRLDYTKGILERFLAVERLLEMHPEWIGRFSFAQIAAPTRSSIGQYQAFEAQVRAEADRIDRRFARGDYRPILLKIEHHEPRDVYEYYRAADVCVVSSLHDGMNLVAKEFVSARDDEQGVLILSRFTGAARELPEALEVNPYDIDQCALALHVALTMPKAEQRERMRIMRGLVREFNVYRWAGRMLLDAASMRKRGHIPAGGTGTA